MIIAEVVVLKAGGAYLPLDPDHPAERIRYLLADAQPVCLVTTATLAARLPAAPELPRLLLNDPTGEPAPPPAGDIDSATARRLAGGFVHSSVRPWPRPTCRSPRCRSPRCHCPARRCPHPRRPPRPARRRHRSLRTGRRHRPCLARDACLAYVEANWTDPRPRSLRERMAAARAGQRSRRRSRAPRRRGRRGRRR
nr:AMP-binding protein [Micromonospora sp. HM5-17]